MNENTHSNNNPLDLLVSLPSGLSVEEIEKEFGDCDWMRAVFNGWTVDAIIFLITEAKMLKADNEGMKRRIKSLKLSVERLENKLAG